MRGLYPIVDVVTLEARGIDPLEAALAILAARPACLQIRAKQWGARATLELLAAVRKEASVLGVPVFANDRPDLAVLAGAHGVHVGQDDVPPGLAKHVAEVAGATLAVGLSTHDRDQLLAALDEPVDYVALGPVFATPTKERPDPQIGLDQAIALAREARSIAPEMKLCAIGGITLEAVPKLREAFDLVAVVSALHGEDGLTGIEARARKLVEAAAT